MNNQENRLQYFDIISGIFIIQMVLFHIFQFADYYENNSWFYPIHNFFFFFMPWFYFKAGFFIKRRENTKECIVNDFKRLIIPWIVWGVIGQLICISFEIFEGEKSLLKILLSPFQAIIFTGAPTGNLPLWFLPSLFLTRLIFQFIPQNRIYVTLIIASILGALLSNWAFLTEGYHKLNIFSVTTVFPGLVFLLVGHLFHTYFYKGSMNKNSSHRMNLLTTWRGNVWSQLMSLHNAWATAGMAGGVGWWMAVAGGG